MAKKTKKLLKVNILVTIVTIIIFFTILEIVFRVTHIRVPRAEMATEWVLGDFDTYIGYVLKPNVSFTQEYSKNPDRVADKKHLGDIIFYNISSQGLRDDTVPEVKEKARIILLGDSWTYGAEVNKNHNIDSNMENFLNGDYNIINLGTGGYNTFQEFRILEKKGIMYKPDIVLTFFLIGNDEITNCYNLGNLPRPYYNGTDIVEPKPPDEGGKDEYLTIKGFEDKLEVYLDELYTYVIFKRRLAAILRKSVILPGIETQMEASELALLKIENITTANNITHLVVILVPGEMIIEGCKKYADFETLHYRLKESLEKNNIDYIDTHPYFISYPKPKTSLYFTSNYFMEPCEAYHPTPEGYELIAKAVVSELRLKGVVK